MSVVALWSILSEFQCWDLHSNWCFNNEFVSILTFMSIHSCWVCVVLPGCLFSDAVGIEPVFWSTRSDAVFICHYRGLERDGHSSWLLWRSCGKVNGKVQSCYRRNWERSAPFYARTSCLPEWVGNCCPPESLNSLCIQKSNNWVLSGKK